MMSSVVRMPDYMAEEFIGHNTLSLIYLVSRRNSVENGKKYALKRCFLMRSGYIKRVLLERQMLEKISLKSPFLPVLEAVFWMGTSAALVMTAGSGMDLYDLIYTHKHMPEESARFYAAEILCGLEHLHDLKIVHMDIKPANILISRSGHVLITDFNTSFDISKGPTSHPLECCGTALYCSPEAASFSTIDEKADIWSWASVLVELVDECVRDPKFSIELLLEIAKKGFIKMKSYARYSKALKGLLKSCFKIDSSSRPSIKKIKRSAFFKEINWNDAENCRLTPPFEINDSDIERARDARQIEAYNPLILGNLHESSMINIHDKILGPNESYSFGILRQNAVELQLAGFTEAKIAELFSNFTFPSTNDHDVAPPLKCLRKK